ncbi:MAG: hypothetical protein NT150_15595 [Bacteroidetes bacterium]|nr:hypothetical protein [Bacteroidota bacterium]
MNYKSTSIRTIMLGAIALSIFAASCKKDTQETTKSDPAAIDNLLSQLDSETQSFTIDPSQPNTLTGADGTVIHIPANALVDANGNVVSGNVTITLKEMLSIKDQITSGFSATCNDSILKSGGQFFFEANANGQKLNVAVNQEITFEIPAEKVDTTMQVFIGNNPKGDEDFTWLPADDSANAVLVVDSVWNNKDTAWNVVNSYQPAYGLEFELGKYIMKVSDLYYTSYFNVDQFIDYATYQGWVSAMPCTITATGNTEEESIDFTVKLVYKKYGASEFFTNQGVVVKSTNMTVNDEFPVGEDVVVLVIGIGQKSKKTYFGKSAFKIANESAPTINVSSMSDAELLTALDNL